MIRRRDVVMRLGAMGPAAFEELCCRLLPRVNPEYEGLEPSTNRDGKTTQGAADAFKRLSDGSYIMVACTTQQSGVRRKILADLQKIADLNVRVSKVVVCMNSALHAEDDIAYQDFALSFGWELQVFSLRALDRLLSEHQDLLAEYLDYTVTESHEPALATPGGFFVGDRLRSLRDGLSLKTSQMVKLLDLGSERRYLNLEADVDECSQDLLVKLHEVFGVNPDWLTEGREPKYEVEYLDWWTDVGAALTSIRALDPVKVHVTLQVDRPGRFSNRVRDFGWQIKSLFSPPSGFVLDYSCHLHVLLCVQTGEYRYRTYETGIALDLWRLNRPRLIRMFYHFLHELIYGSTFEVVGACLPTWRLDSDLCTGRVHPKTVISQAVPHFGFEWPYEVIDFAGARLPTRKAAEQYGSWFPLAQETFENALFSEES